MGELPGKRTGQWTFSRRQRYNISVDSPRKKENTLLNLDYDKLRTAILDAARLSFTNLLEAHPDEQFYAFSLYTDDDVTSVYSSANSEEEYQQAIIKFKEAFDEDEMEKADLNSLRWAYVEWAYDCFGKVYFEDLNNLLGDINQNKAEMTINDFIMHKKQVLNALITALYDLNKEGLFGDGEDREQVTVFASTSDCDSDEGFQSQNDSAKILNPESVFQSFLTRYE